MFNYFPSIPSVIRLFFCSSPSAIRRSIISIVVDAINGMQRWSASHIREKVTEVFPTVTNPNPSSTVEEIIRIVTIVTSGMHMRPASVFWRNSDGCVTRFPVLNHFVEII